MKSKNEDIYDAGFEEGYRMGVKENAGTGTRNETAFVIGVIAGLIGIWGLAHVLNDKVLPGCLWMFIIGPALAAILGGIAIATAGIGALVAIPLWLYLVYTQAKNGASRV